MGHAERVLRPGERIVYRARLHWIAFAPGVLSVVAGSIVALCGAGLTDGAARYGYLAIGAALGAAGLFSLLRAGVRRMKTELVVSTRRIIYKPGWGRRGAGELDLRDAETLTVSQGVLGRRLDFGTVTVRAGGAVVGPVSNVAAPRDFQLPSAPAEP
jgi:hypothetical protein